MGMIEDTKSKAEEQKAKAHGKKVEAEIQEMGADAVLKITKVGGKIKGIVKK